MRALSQDHAVLLAAAYLRVPNRRLRALVRGEDESLREWVAGETARRLAHARHQAKEAAGRLAALHARIVTIAEAEYPAGLRDLHDPPAFLTVRGALAAHGIAIVGSRTPPEPAVAFARALAARCGEPVISGLALGIDAAAHAGALEAGAATVAYVGTGLGVTYPPQHAQLEKTIVANGGAVASERLPDEPVTKWALVHRDRLQAAHARATILIASEPDGGAMQTMRFAEELGRPRFAVELSGDGYGGNAHAIALGAIPLPFDLDRALAVLHARTH